MRRYLVLLSMLLVMAPLALARAEIVVSFYSRDLQLRGLGIAYPHAFFLIKGNVGPNQTPVAKGYGFTAKWLTPAVWAGPVAGMIWPHKMDDAKISKRHVSLSITEEQYARLMDVVKRWGNRRQPSYNLNSDNCVTFVKDAALAVGLPAAAVGKHIQDPRGYLDDLNYRIAQAKAGRVQVASRGGAAGAAGKPLRRKPQVGFTGTWNIDRANCQRDPDSNLRITTKRAVLKPNYCEFRKVSRQRAGTWRVNAVCHVDGKPSKSTIQLVAKSGVLQWSSKNGKENYYRCDG